MANKKQGRFYVDRPGVPLNRYVALALDKRGLKRLWEIPVVDLRPGLLFAAPLSPFREVEWEVIGDVFKLSDGHFVEATAVGRIRLGTGRKMNSEIMPKTTLLFPIYP